MTPSLRTGFINPREPRCVRPGAVAEARRRWRTRTPGTSRRSNDGHGPGRRNQLSDKGLGRSASARGVARRSRTGRPGTPRSSRLAGLAARPSAAAGIYETGSKTYRRSPACRVGCYMPHLCSGQPSECLMRQKAYYPLFADLNGRLCVVVGGGRVAQRKVTTLLGFGARITVVSPQITKTLAAYARRGRIRHVKRRFKACDLDGAWLVYAATDDVATNALVHKTAKHLHIFANVVDQTPLCSFIAPAILRRGPLTVAVSTGGASPSLAKKLRQDLSRQIGDSYVPMLKLLLSLRGIAKKKMPDYHDRKVFFDKLVSGPVFSLVRSGKPAKARQTALALLDRGIRKNGGI